jgi:hypothetical protein
MDKTISNRMFIALIAVYVLMAGLSVLLPQDAFGVAMPAEQMPAAPVIVALANAGIVLVLYGGLGFVGLLLARKLGLPEIWDSAISNRGRFLVPALIGLGLGIVFIIADLIFSRINGIGRLVHPPFVTAIVASISAGIGEEIMFRALAFAMAHLPALMFIQGWTEFSQIPTMLLVEIVVLNGLLAIFAAYAFWKYGFLAAVGVHFWTDIVWHVLWGLF